MEDARLLPIRLLAHSGATFAPRRCHQLLRVCAPDLAQGEREARQKGQQNNGHYAETLLGLYQSLCQVVPREEERLGGATVALERGSGEDRGDRGAGRGDAEELGCQVAGEDSEWLMEPKED